MPNLLPLASRIRNLIVSLSLVALLYFIWYRQIYSKSSARPSCDVLSPYDATALGTEFTKSEPLIIRCYSTLVGWSEPRKLVTEGDTIMDYIIGDDEC